MHHKTCASRSHRLRPLVLALCAVLPCLSQAQNSITTGLSSLSGKYSSAYGVSEDGSVVVGGEWGGPDNDYFERAFRWTSSGKVYLDGDYGSMPFPMEIDFSKHAWAGVMSGPSG